MAIRYDPDTMPAPMVIAKGAGLMGQRIRDAAGQHNIATVEKQSLAQAVYRSVAVNRPIPAEHYTAVAEVLTAVYQRDAEPKLPTPWPLTVTQSRAAVRRE